MACEEERERVRYAGLGLGRGAPAARTRVREGGRVEDDRVGKGEEVAEDEGEDREGEGEEGVFAEGNGWRDGEAVHCWRGGRNAHLRVEGEVLGRERRQKSEMVQKMVRRGKGQSGILLEGFAIERSG